MDNSGLDSNNSSIENTPPEERVLPYSKEEIAAEYLRYAIEVLDSEEYCTACGTHGKGIYVKRTYPALKDPLDACGNCGQLMNYNDLVRLLSKYAKFLEVNFK